MFMGRPKKTDNNERDPKAASAPYLPLGSYDITIDVAGLIPRDIAQKYSIMPVEQTGNIISLVMEDPLNEEAVRVVETLTGCVVRRFVGTHSEIEHAISSYIPETSGRTKKAESSPDSIDDGYDIRGPSFKDDGPWNGKTERRSAFRFKCDFDAHFPDKTEYISGKVIDISYTGMAVMSKNSIPVGTYLSVRIDLPDGVPLAPTAFLLLVLRSTRIDAASFCIGGKLFETSNGEIKRVVKYFSSNENAKKTSYKGLDRRKYDRFSSNIKFWFPADSSYLKTGADDISECGFSFRSRGALPKGSYLPVEIVSPNNIIIHPIVCMTEVTRVTAAQKGYFTIGVRWFKPEADGITRIINYLGKNARK